MNPSALAKQLGVPHLLAASNLNSIGTTDYQLPYTLAFFFAKPLGAGTGVTTQLGLLQYESVIVLRRRNA